MSAKIISESYVQGVREGRDTLRAHLAHGIARNEAVRAEILNLKALLSSGFAPPMRDFFRGQYDFWKRQYHN